MNWFSPVIEKHRVPALLEADELLVAEVPAPRPLIEIAADRPLIADLRRADFDRRRDDRGIQPRDVGVLGQIDHLHGRADPQAAVDRGHRRLERALHVDEAIGLRDVVLHPRQQVLAAADRQRLLELRRERGDRVLLVGRVDVSKRFHEAS